MKAGNEQHIKSDFFFHCLDICCSLIEKKYGRGSIRNWTNGDYVKLSAQILRETGTLVSANTLKRIFGKIRTSSRYYPQKATRDALARYTGFRDWDELEEKQRPAEDGEPVSRTRQRTSPGRRKRKISGILVLLAALFLLTIWIRSGRSPEELENIHLVCENPIGGNPHSAIFRLKLPEGFPPRFPDLLLDYGDGKHEKLNPPNTLITHYYEIPGRYYATLNYRDERLDTIPVYLKTDGWTATGTMVRDTTRVYPVLNTPLFRNGTMTLDGEDLYHAGIDTNRTFFVHYVLSKPLGISGDNFILTAKVKTSPPRPGVRCSQLVVTVFGEKTDHNFFIIKPGCVTWSGLRFSEIVKEGKYNDLSFLGADLTGGGSFRLEVADQSVRLWINGSQVHTTSYQVPLKEIRGLKFAFAGTGFVDRIFLKDRSTGKVYEENFGE